MCSDHLPTSPNMLHWIIGKSEGPPSKSCFLFCIGGLNWKSPWTKDWTTIIMTKPGFVGILTFLLRGFFLSVVLVFVFFKWVVQPPQANEHMPSHRFAGQLGVSEGMSDCHFSILTAYGSCCNNNWQLPLEVGKHEHLQLPSIWWLLNLVS